MLGYSQKLTEGLIIYSVLVSDYEKLDFKDDALAGVRANYFNYYKTPQSEKTEIQIGSNTFNLYYSMKKGESLLWKVARNNRPYQSVKKEAGDIYSVFFYNENGIVTKRAYFDFQHNWIRTEYYDKRNNNFIVCKIFPRIICGITVLEQKRFYPGGKEKSEILFPSKKVKIASPSVLIYSNSGMIWYDAAYKPEEITEDMLTYENDAEIKAGNVAGFGFKAEYFSPKNTEKIDISTVKYLSEDDIPKVEVAESSTIKEAQINKPYSAYDTIENILTEAHKSNKHLFGEIINQTVEQGVKEISVEEVIKEQEVEENIENSAEISVIDKVSADENSADDSISEVSAKENSVDNSITEISADEILADDFVEVSEDNVPVDEELTNEIIDETTDKTTEISVEEANSEYSVAEENYNCDNYSSTETVSDRNTDTEEADSMGAVQSNSSSEYEIDYDELIRDIEATAQTSEFEEETDETEAYKVEEEVLAAQTGEVDKEVDEVETDDVDKKVNEADTEDNFTKKSNENEENKENEENQDIDESNFDVCTEKNCDVLIVTKSGRYSYYGEIDEYNYRTGLGRTVSPNGITLYEGNYVDDKRNGFGVCYYKNGKINYVGNWDNNNRNGAGVGYRLSDGTMHAGKWKSNIPEGYGARFDGNGNFIDVSMYTEGVKNGKSVSFDENGNVVITIWKDGNKLSEHTINIGD